MAAFTTTPTPAGEGPSVLGIAAAIGAKIRDAAENAKEEREKAKEAGENPKKGSLFKSALANQFNPIKSKKAKSNWAKQFSWNKPKDKPVTPPTEGDGANGSAKLKEFIAGGFTAILKDTGMMVAKLGGISVGVGENLAATTSSSGTLTAIKETLDAQTDLRRKALEEAKYARAEKQLEKTQDTSTATAPTAESAEDKGGGEGGEGGNPFEWMLNLLGLGDLASNLVSGKLLQKLNPFKKSPVTQGAGGAKPKPSGGPKVTTSGGAAASGSKLGGMKSLLSPKNIFSGVKGLGVGLALDWGVNQITTATGDAISNKVASDINALPPEKKQKAIENLQSQLQKEREWQSGGGGVFDKILTLGGLLGESSSESKAGGIERILGKVKMSEGGIVPSAVPPSPVSPMAQGGIVDNPTKTNLNPGDSVIPLNRNVGKKMFGGAKDVSAGETAVDTVGAMILGVASGMLGKTESGTAGDAVRQDIRKAAKEFGISNLTFTSSIGKAKFGVVDANKTAKDFMMSLFKNITLGGGGGGGKKGGGGGGDEDKPPGADLENTGVKNEIDLSSGKGAVQFTDGFDPTGSILGRGRPHMGQDIGTGGEKGWYVAMKKTGKVTFSGFEPGGGNSVYIDTGGGVEYRFMHLKDPSPLKEGQDYNGETIGEIGNTGRSSGEHLHFEKLVNGKHVDPKNDADALLDIGKQTIKNFKPQSAKPPVVTAPDKADPGTRGSGAQASLPDANVTQIAQRGMIGKAQDGMVGKKEPAWWDIGGRINNWLDNSRENATIGGNKFGGDRYKQQMKELGYAKGGKSDVMKANAAKLKAKRASEQRSRLGVQKVNGKWVNMGVSDRAVGSNPWWQVWNKKGATAERKAKQEALAKNLADRLNKQEAAKVKPQAPKPRPSAPASPASGVRPTPTASASGAQAATVVTPTVQSSPNKSYTSTAPGGNVPSGRSMASTFADFLYADLIE